MVKYDIYLLSFFVTQLLVARLLMNHVLLARLPLLSGLKWRFGHQQGEVNGLDH